MKLPLIVGMGGMNAAGRSSGFHSYKRMISDVLSPSVMAATWQDLAHRMGLPAELSDATIAAIKSGTLVRRIENFDPTKVRINHKVCFDAESNSASIIMKQSKCSDNLKAQSTQELLPDNNIRLTFTNNIDAFVSDEVALAVSSGGSLPAGFSPGALYSSHHHPRGLQLTIYGASDALNSLGIEWDTILQHIRPDEVAVYAGSALSQVDADSFAGLFSAAFCGQRVNSKMMALSLAEMPADFINSYVLNSLGSTGSMMGACASFLYNLKQGMQDIQAGRARIVIVGNAEAPLVPAVIEGFRVMGALATDESLRALDKSETIDHRRACRPFSTNSGFTLAESAQFVVLMDDELALELGATIYGSVADVFVNADANKKSIAGPGIGNYITVAKATALARAILGEEGLKQTYVHAHGTGTPQNRTSESHILNTVAENFGIKHWPVTAIKSYLGHSVGTAAGDQLITALGVWQYGWIPGITTIDHIAQDVHHTNLNILMEHKNVGYDMKGVIINSKGFGGNNATGLVLSPLQTMEMLSKKYGTDIVAKYLEKNKTILQQQRQRDAATCLGNERIIYSFGESVLEHSAMLLTTTQMSFATFKHAITLPTKHMYQDYV